MPPLASNFLIPNGTFVAALVALPVLLLLVVWPFVETLVRQKWVYTLGVVVLGPIGGLLWFVIGRPRTTSRRPNRLSSGVQASR